MILDLCIAPTSGCPPAEPPLRPFWRGELPRRKTVECLGEIPGYLGEELWRIKLPRTKKEGGHSAKGKKQNPEKSASKKETTSNYIYESKDQPIQQLHTFSNKTKTPSLETMHIEQLANELVLDIFQSCTSVTDVRNLASTCHHFHKVFISRRLPILFQAAEAQIGPLSDAIQLVTHNASQPVHIPRPSPPLSDALLTSLLTVGQVANKWAAIYPIRKWRGRESDCRRLLSSTECYRLRRALYRHWLYSLAFHDPLHPRTTRDSRPIILSRAALFRPWPTSQLAELLDLHAIFRDVLISQICPSNGTVLRRHRARFPDEPAPTLIHARLSSLHHSHHREQQQQGEHGLHSPRQTSLWSPEHFYSSPHKRTRLDHDDNDAAESWGDEIAQYYIVEDMLKLNPDQLLQLYEQVATTDGRRRGVVERFVAGFVLGGSCCGVGSEGWFENNGETLVETVDSVLGSRGECADWLKEEVKVGGGEGIVRE